MSPLEEAIVNKKLSVIVEALKVLEPIKGMSLDDYRKDIYKRKAAERLLQELIEAAIDTNAHIITASGHAAPNDYYESFTRLGELGVIDMQLAKKLAPSAGLRNRLVHEYDDINDSVVYDAIGFAEELYPKYLQAIESYISDNH